MKVSFESVLIGVSSIEKAVSFYEAVLGVTFEENRPPFSCFTMDGIEFDVEEDSPERSAGWKEWYLGTAKPISFKVDDVHAFLDMVIAHGGKIVSEPEDKSWGWREARFADLDGNSFIVNQEL